MRDLEYDLKNSQDIRNACHNNIFAQNLYAALCNMAWKHPDRKEQWSCTWRYAGGLVASLRIGEDYMDWYCSGIASDEVGYVTEGTVTDEVRLALERLGWTADI